MADTYVGPRIRELRTRAGLTQSALARTIEVSPSYLNLIERGKRPLPAPLAPRIARALNVPAEDIDTAAEARLVDTLTEIASLPSLSAMQIEASAATAFVGRYPGWARAIASLARSEQSAQQAARALADRLTHDPVLAETIHRMLSRVAAIRSSAEILADYTDLPPAQQARFHRIVVDEAAALSEVGEALAAYLGKSDETQAALTPQDEVEALFEANSNRFPDLETGGNAQTRIERIITASSALETDAARRRARTTLAQYAKRAERMPAAAFAERAHALAYDIEALADMFDVGVDDVCRRLSSLPAADGRPSFGYIRANAAGAILEMLALPNLAVPRFAEACPLWVLFRAQQTPETTVRQRADFPNGRRFVFAARARVVEAGGFGRPRHLQTDMLTMSEPDAALTVYAPGGAAILEPVGPGCRLCPREACAHRVDDPLGA